MKFDAKTIKKTFKWLMFVLLGAVYYVASNDNSTVVMVSETTKGVISTIFLTANNDSRFVQDIQTMDTFRIAGYFTTDNFHLNLQTKKRVNGEEIDFEDIKFEGIPARNHHISKIEIKLNQSNDTASQAFYGGSFSYVSQPGLVMTYNSINSDNYVRLDNGQYSSQFTSACTGHRIFFKVKDTVAPLLDTYLKKKKKDTRIDVYLSDNGRRDFTIPFRRLSNWITSLF